MPIDVTNHAVAVPPVYVPRYPVNLHYENRTYRLALALPNF